MLALRKRLWVTEDGPRGPRPVVIADYIAPLPPGGALRDFTIPIAPEGTGVWPVTSAGVKYEASIEVVDVPGMDDDE